HRLIEVHLSDTYFGVSNKCLQLLSCLGNVDTPLNKDGQGLVPAVGDAQRVISDYFSNQDPRVHTAAIKAMILTVTFDFDPPICSGTHYSISVSHMSVELVQFMSQLLNLVMFIQIFTHVKFSKNSRSRQ
uniref:Uncharacterized protein n=1 Tax=Salmo trutta TaxID=8032 RepID=A0A673XFP6_SALTR